jgi:ABC-type glycerol-3-phosphate transport system substrate-binding protein
MNKTAGILLAGGLALAGCGGPSADQATAPATTTDEPTENRELLDAAREPINRAKAVEGIQDEQKRAMDAQIEQAER